MNPAASVFFFDNKFDNFLHASIGADGNGMTLSVLSALARLDVDPWEEAGELSKLSKELGAQRLAALISRLPDPQRADEDTGALADRLIRLLPHAAVSSVFSPPDVQTLLISLPYLTIVKILVGAALAAMLLMMVVGGVSSARLDHSNPNVSGAKSITQSQ